MVDWRGYKLISFDLQGTLSDSAFSDEFWLELLPQLYAERNEVSLVDAKAVLKERFKSVGRYHRLYYCPQDWIEELCPTSSFGELVRRLSNAPMLFPDTLELVRELFGTVPLIILSTTTREFIASELGDAQNYFDGVYSTVDDLGTAGKTTEIFRHITDLYNVSAKDALHIGDCKEMDIENAERAGLSTFFFDRKRPRGEIVAELRTILFEQN